MSTRTMVLQACVLLVAAILANATVKNNAIRLTILESETRSVSLGTANDLPKNCDGLTYDAYCRNSRTVQITNTLLVQESDKPPFRISCNIDTKFSRCVPLPKGATFDARREKHGITVYYVGDNGKMRKQLYALVEQGPEAASAAGAVTNPPAPASAATTPQVSAAAIGPAATTGLATAVPGATENVKCSFTSTPAGAEIAVDGRYVGSTPSVLSLSAGPHTVIMSLPAFAQWKRELTVTPGSELTVNAVLEKTQ
jgi:hypothetical protein